MKRYGMYGTRTRDFVTCDGRIVVTGNRQHIEGLVRGTRSTVIARELPTDIPVELTIPLRYMPEMGNVRFPDTDDQPLDEGQFRRD